VDHDTTAGLREAMRLAAVYHVQVVPGIEISAFDESSGRKAHILGLFLPPGCTELESFCAPVREQRREAAPAMLARLRAAGYRIDESDLHLPPGGTAFKNHFLAALRSAGYGGGDPEALEALFAAERPFRPAGPAYVLIRYPRARDAVAAVRTAGGLPVLAHPGLYGNFDLLEELVAAGLGGIEAAHPAHSAEQEASCRELAGRRGLGVSGGSDFHGELDDPRHALGCRGVGDEDYRRLRELAARG
jgi:predicted metal-dependent phosphoesterase TrpH